MTNIKQLLKEAQEKINEAISLIEENKTSNQEYWTIEEINKRDDIEKAPKIKTKKQMKK